MSKFTKRLRSLGLKAMTDAEIADYLENMEGVLDELSSHIGEVDHRTIGSKRLGPALFPEHSSAVFEDILKKVKKSETKSE